MYNSLKPVYEAIVKAWRKVNASLGSGERVELVGGGDMAYISAVQGLGGLFARKKTRNCVHCDVETTRLGDPVVTQADAEAAQKRGQRVHPHEPKSRSLADLHSYSHSPPPEWTEGDPWIPIHCPGCGFSANTEEVKFDPFINY